MDTYTFMSNSIYLLNLTYIEIESCLALQPRVLSERTLKKNFYEFNRSFCILFQIIFKSIDGMFTMLQPLLK